jgi:hypothetical protein
MAYDKTIPNGGARYSFLAVQAEPFSEDKLIRQLRATGLFEFVSREVNGAGGGISWFKVPQPVVFPRGPSSRDGELFLSKLVSEAFPASEGYITSKVRTGKPFCYAFDVIGHGGSIFSKNHDYWDRAQVEINMARDLMGGPEDVDVYIEVEASIAKGPSDRLPPKERFKRYDGAGATTGWSNPEDAVIDLLVGGRGWNL